ncbi:glycoside hydrolase family 19 protein [Chitinimonas arctica]|uniref:Glycoside hydrolase family 19 protein n=1 Tax=Chitinimonas arctica TaxID=2594795 RepID=A0A516SJP2_9NEIS|nr:glycoside hydrolase family 19 protein [Chitinimonas arctica]QDQ28382.1 glycoside hydrolase family 19 protein [Chitinimonas arctica]
MTRDDFALAASLSEKMAERWYAPLCAAMARFEIDDPVRIAAFIAQTGHETLGFTHTQEIWGPTPAQQAYEPPAKKAAQLGNVAAGDGHRFRGRGLIQITGRSNYRQCGEALGLDLLDQPELLAGDECAALSAAWWWSQHGCNSLADGGDFTALTKRINGGTNGIDDRLRRWEIAKTHLGV